MKKLMLILCLLLLVAGCKDNTITGKVITDVDNTDTSETTDSTREEVKPATKQVTNPVERDDPEASDSEEYADVTDVKTYDTKGECTVDSTGVVRYFDEDGKKTVYRTECDFGFLVTYSCDANKVASKSTKCLGECFKDRYADKCQ